MPPSSPADTVHDVIVLGSGLAGSTLATILARHGLKVLMLEAGQHPRFAIGESVVPEFGARAQLLAQVYDVPELGQIGDFPGLSEHVSGNSGIKRSFSFVRHEPDAELDPANAWQFQTLTQPLGPDSHIYRPDLDTWLTALAVRHGADYHDRSAVTGIEIGDSEVRVQVGERSHVGRFVVDGTGFRSILAEQLGLRDERALNPQEVAAALREHPHHILALDLEHHDRRVTALEHAAHFDGERVVDHLPPARFAVEQERVGAVPLDCPFANLPAAADGVPACE